MFSFSKQNMNSSTQEYYGKRESINYFCLLKKIKLNLIYKFAPHVAQTEKTIPIYGLNTSNEVCNQTFNVSKIDKSKAKRLRIFAFLFWCIAIGLEVVAYFSLQSNPINYTKFILLIVGILLLSVTGSFLWKKANRLNPTSRKNKFKFFVQSQLGVIMSIIAFAPLIVLIFMNKDMDKKQKGIFGGIAIVALIIAGLSGTDINPPSIEQYTEQTKQVKSLNNDLNHVFWTKSGQSYHLFSDCSYINTYRTKEIFEGTVVQSRELKNITDLCDRCERNAKKE